MRVFAAAALAVVLISTANGCGGEPVSVSGPSATQASGSTPSESATPEESDPVGTAAAPEVPASLRVDGVGSWGLVAAGTTAEGIINPPAGTVQWYDASPRPGAAGIAVIAGHVSTAGVPDVFTDLDLAQVGGRVVVSDTAGVDREFEITTVRSADKDEIMVDPAVWGPSEVPRLAIVTCDASSSVEAGGHLAANLVVEAVATG